MEFVYKHKKSIVNQREVGMDTKRTQRVGERDARKHRTC